MLFVKYASVPTQNLHKLDRREMLVRDKVRNKVKEVLTPTGTCGSAPGSVSGGSHSNTCTILQSPTPRLFASYNVTHEYL